MPECSVHRKARVLLKQSFVAKNTVFSSYDAAYVLVDPSGPGLVQH